MGIIAVVGLGSAVGAASFNASPTGPSVPPGAVPLAVTSDPFTLIDPASRVTPTHPIEVYAQFGDQLIPATEGLIIGQFSKDGNGQCVVNREVGMSAVAQSADIPTPTLTFGLDADCRVIVQSIRFPKQTDK